MTRPLTLQEARVIADLNAMHGDDQEAEHSRADDLLVELVHPEVQAAYKAACDRVGFWYA